MCWSSIHVGGDGRRTRVRRHYSTPTTRRDGSCDITYRKPTLLSLTGLTRLAGVFRPPDVCDLARPRGPGAGAFATAGGPCCLAGVSQRTEVDAPVFSPVLRFFVSWPPLTAGVLACSIFDSPLFSPVSHHCHYLTPRTILSLPTTLLFNINALLPYHDLPPTSATSGLPLPSTVFFFPLCLSTHPAPSLTLH